jgi:hypothetical protein
MVILDLWPKEAIPARAPPEPVIQDYTIEPVLEDYQFFGQAIIGLSAGRIESPVLLGETTRG